MGASGVYVVHWSTTYVLHTHYGTHFGSDYLISTVHFLCLTNHIPCKNSYWSDIFKNLISLHMAYGIFLKSFLPIFFQETNVYSNEIVRSTRIFYVEELLDEIKQLTVETNNWLQNKLDIGLATHILCSSAKHKHYFWTIFCFSSKLRII